MFKLFMSQEELEKMKVVLDRELKRGGVDSLSLVVDLFNVLVRAEPVLAETPQVENEKTT